MIEDPTVLRRLKRQVLDKGQSVALALEKLMNGLDVRLEDLGAGRDFESERDKRRRLRKLLDQIDRVVKSFDAGTFGTCADCGGRIEDDRLREMPWTSRCGACFQKAVREGTL